MATSTGLVLTAALFRRAGLGMVIPEAHIGSIAAGTVTSVNFFRSQTWGSNHFQLRQTLIWRPGNATGVADDVRWAASLDPDTGVLSNDSNWADTTLSGDGNWYLIDWAIHPTWIVDAINNGVRRYGMAEGNRIFADPGFTRALTETTAFEPRDAVVAYIMQCLFEDPRVNTPDKEFSRQVADREVEMYNRLLGLQQASTSYRSAQEQR